MKKTSGYIFFYSHVIDGNYKIAKTSVFISRKPFKINNVLKPSKNLVGIHVLELYKYIRTYRYEEYTRKIW